VQRLELSLPYVVTKHKDVKELSLRSDMFFSRKNDVIPRFNNNIAREHGCPAVVAGWLT
jgi:hypothetical protein